MKREAEDAGAASGSDCHKLPFGRRPKEEAMKQVEGQADGVAAGHCSGEFSDEELRRISQSVGGEQPARLRTTVDYVVTAWRRIKRSRSNGAVASTTLQH